MARSSLISFHRKFPGTGLAIALASAPLCSSPLAAAPDGAVGSLSNTRLDESRLGKQTFDEKFELFDAGADQQRGSRPHRWRTVMGYGGPTSFENYKLSASSVGIDASFSGVSSGKMGKRPLGLDPFEVRSGQSLTILARPIPAELQPAMWNAKFYSGQITTKFSFSQLYGYFEMEAMLPAGKGFWPQFWLLPQTAKWPSGGEIDILEGLGNPREIYTTLHWSAEHKSEQRKIRLPFDASAGFHRYGALWTPKSIAWYVDRQEVMRIATPAEVNQPMFMLLGLAVGGAWGGYPDSTTKFPGRYVIRRVQAWSLRPD